MRQRLHAATGVPETAMAVARAGEPLEVTADGSLVPVLVDTEERAVGCDLERLPDTDDGHRRFRNSSRRVQSLPRNSLRLAAGRGG